MLLCVYMVCMVYTKPNHKTQHHHTTTPQHHSMDALDELDLMIAALQAEMDSASVQTYYALADQMCDLVSARDNLAYQFAESKDST